MATRGAHRHLVSLAGPSGPAVPDGDGGWTTPSAPLDPPTWYVSVRRASVRDVERLAAGTAVASATHLLEGDWHPGITRQSTITFEGRVFYVADVVDVEERHVAMVLLCQEVVS
jgi:hypothetical protein